MKATTPPGAISNQHSSAQDGDEKVMALLQKHVPLSLLLDLTDPAGPVSAEILAKEGPPETSWWER
jgi:hypothetical protein